RHEPWRYVASVSTSEYQELSFTPTDDVLICGQTASVYDANSGRLLHTLGVPAASTGLSPFTFPLRGGQEVAQIDQRTANVYDTRTGDEIKRISFPPEIDDFLAPKAIIATSPVDRGVITFKDWTPRSRTLDGFRLWNLDHLDRPLGSTAPAGGSSNSHGE